MSQIEADETILDLAESHPEYSIDQFSTDFKSIIGRDPTAGEKRNFLKAVKNTKNISLVINGYTFGKVLGKGSFGEVYKCQKGGKEYAVKHMDETKMSAEMEEYFADEVGARLNSPFLVRYFEKFRGPTKELYIVMELCSKGDLRSRIEMLKGLGALFSVPSVMKISIQVILGLDLLHLAKFLHRDLKPENVYVNDMDDAKIGDFGCVRELDTASGAASTVIGTPVYESPQVIRGEKYDASADMWALGVLIYELIMLERPFKGANMHLLHQAVFSGVYPPIPKGRCPVEVAEIVTALLNVDPQRRPSARDLLRNPFIRAQAASLKVACGKSLLDYFPELTAPPAAITPSKPSTPPPSVPLGVGSTTKTTTPPAASVAYAVLAYPTAHDHYEGSVKGGIPHGRGVCKYSSDGRCYDGEWAEGKRAGKGTMVWTDGKTYAGDWANDHYEGNGVMTSSVGEVTSGVFRGYSLEEGKWVQGYPNGDRYVGGWANDRMEGNGMWTSNTGDKYEGDWKNGIREGKGIYVWAGGNKYEGDWKNGTREGKGTLVWANGTKYVGEFVKGVFNGYGVKTTEKGKIIYSGKWQDGKPV